MSIKEAKWIKLAVVICIVATMCWAVSLPFFYESQTLWYKFGWQKTILRIGKISGLLTFVLLLIQIIGAIRIKLFVDIYGIAKLMLFHRIVGVLILILRIFHVSCILIPEGVQTLPKEGVEPVLGSDFGTIFFRQQLYILYIDI